MTCHRYPSCECALPTECRHRSVRLLDESMTLGRLAILKRETGAEIQFDRGRFWAVSRSEMVEVTCG